MQRGDGGSGSLHCPPPSGRISVQQSVFNLVNCILGAGLLGYPYCFR